jgi:hypothetical protein
MYRGQGDREPSCVTSSETDKAQSWAKPDTSVRREGVNGRRLGDARRVKSLRLSTKTCPGSSPAGLSSAWAGSCSSLPEPRCALTEPCCTTAMPRCALAEPCRTSTRARCALAKPRCKGATPCCALTEPRRTTATARRGRETDSLPVFPIHRLARLHRYAKRCGQADCFTKVEWSPCAVPDCRTRSVRTTPAAPRRTRRFVRPFQRWVRTDSSSAYETNHRP